MAVSGKPTAGYSMESPSRTIARPGAERLSAAEIVRDIDGKRVLSGMRPTGPLHIGHYLGALGNWVWLQEHCECFYFVADWHALSTMYDEPETLAQYTREIVMDWLAVGIDPQRSTLFLQSAILEHAELFLLLSMITPLGWLERVPSYKEVREQLSHKDLATLGFLGYPLLQTADIIIYRANYVPVGEDQLPHLEHSREVARRFNAMYPEKGGQTIFPEPWGILTEATRVPGKDGRKMSKSYGNAIFLKDSEKTVWETLRPMVTDPARIRRNDPGDPEKCPVFELHRHFTDAGRREEVSAGCRSAGIGCVDCKKVLFDGLETVLGPIRERRARFEGDPGLVRGILEDGTSRARKVCQETMARVRDVLGLYRVSV